MYINCIFLTKIGKSNKISKKVSKKFGGYIKKLYLCIAFQGKHIKFGLWCNGSTTGFGSVCPGSNPGSPTMKREDVSQEHPLFLFFSYRECVITERREALPLSPLIPLFPSREPSRTPVAPSADEESSSREFPTANRRIVGCRCPKCGRCNSRPLSSSCVPTHALSAG